MFLFYCVVEEGHVDGNLVDNVAESGDDSEDEWNYYKGEGEREKNPDEEIDEALRTETPCQDNVSIYYIKICTLNSKVNEWPLIKSISAEVITFLNTYENCDAIVLLF